MRLSVNQALKTKNEAKKLSMFSKQWTPGDVIRAVYPIFWDDESGTWQLLAGAVWGYRVGDIKALNLHTAFIPALTEFDENGNPVGTPDIAFKFSRIARAFVSGQKAAKEAAILNKKFPTEAMRKEALEKVANEFDSKNNRNAVRPIISSPSYLITTECITYSYKNERVDTSTATLVSQPLSDKNIRRLTEIVSDIKYTPDHVDQAVDYIEVEWNFPSDPSKAQSSMASTVTGLSTEMRTATKDPETWKKLMPTINLLADDSSVIVKRATRRVDENKLQQALTAYSVMQSEDLDALNIVENEQDIDSLVRNLDILDELQITKTISNTEILNKLEEAKAKQHSSTDVSESIPNPVPDAPTLNTLLNNSATEQAQVQAAAAVPTPEPAPAPTPAVEPTVFIQMQSAAAPAVDVPAQAAPAPAVDVPTQDVIPAMQSAATVQNLSPTQAETMNDSEIEEVDLAL